MWSHDELPDDELILMAQELQTHPCECKTPEESGTRNGYTCSPHRAHLELKRRGGLRLAAEAEL